MSWLPVSASALLLAALTLTATPAWAGSINLYFEIATPNGNPVTDLVIYSAAPGVDDIFLAPDTLAPDGVQSLTHAVPFDPTSALVVGVNAGVGAEGAHIIMFTNDDFASAAVGLKWSELFSSPRHNAFISFLTGAHAGDAASLDAVSDFLRGSEAAAAAFDPSGSYSILQFSVTEPPIGRDVPEPGTVAALGLGLTALAWTLQRRWSPKRV